MIEITIPEYVDNEILNIDGKFIDDPGMIIVKRCCSRQCTFYCSDDVGCYCTLGAAKYIQSYAQQPTDRCPGPGKYKLERI